MFNRCLMVLTMRSGSCLPKTPLVPFISGHEELQRWICVYQIVRAQWTTLRVTVLLNVNVIRLLQKYGKKRKKVRLNDIQLPIIQLLPNRFHCNRQHRVRQSFYIIMSKPISCLSDRNRRKRFLKKKFDFLGSVLTQLFESLVPSACKTKIGQKFVESPSKDSST